MCSLYRRDQEVCKVILNDLLPVAVGLAQFDEHAEEAKNAKGQFLTVVGAFWYVIYCRSRLDIIFLVFSFYLYCH